MLAALNELDLHDSYYLQMEFDAHKSEPSGRPGLRKSRRRDVSLSRDNLACPPVIDVTTFNLSNHAEVWMATGKRFQVNKKSEK